MSPIFNPDQLFIKTATSLTTPVILRGIGKSWSLFKHLQSGSLAQGSRAFNVTYEEIDGNEVTVSFKRFCSIFDNGGGVYLKEMPLSYLVRNISRELPKYIFDCDWLQQLDSAVRPPWLWLFMGDAGTCSAFHVDVAGSSAWNMLTKGRKLWNFFPPEYAQKWGYLPKDIILDLGTSDSPVFGMVQLPGDVVFTPSGWLHEVHNLEASVAVTGNFINRSNWSFCESMCRALNDTNSLKMLDVLKRSNL